MSVGGGVSGRRSEDFITEREYTKIKCRSEGGEWKEEGRLKLSAGGKGVSGRRREDFITEREHTKIKQVPVGRE